MVTFLTSSLIGSINKMAIQNGHQKLIFTSFSVESCRKLSTFFLFFRGCTRKKSHFFEKMTFFRSFSVTFEGTIEKNIHLNSLASYYSCPLYPEGYSGAAIHINAHIHTLAHTLLMEGPNLFLYDF